MKKTEAISILATSVRPREPKDRARYDEAVKMAIEALKCSETPKSSEQNAETAQADHIADSGKKVERTGKPSQDVSDSDLIFRKAAIDALHAEIVKRRITGGANNGMLDEFDTESILRKLSSAKPDRKLIDDYMWKIKQNISPHTAAEGVIAIKYYLEQIYEQIYGKGEKPKWMT